MATTDRSVRISDRLEEEIVRCLAKDGSLEMIRVPEDRTPTHPGEMLREEFLKPMGITQSELSIQLRVPYQRVNELVNGKRGVTPGTALRLAKYFGMSAGFWMNLQLRWDLFHAQRAEADALKKIPTLSRAAGAS